MSMLTSYRDKVVKLSAKYDVMVDSLKKHEEEREVVREALKDHEESRKLFQEAAHLTQKQLEARISENVTLAMAAVWDDPYKFKIDFVQRRNSTECDLLFEREGHTMSPLDSSGYGAADVASLSLRVSYWSMGSSRACLIWDEPCRQLSTDKHAMASDIIREISSKMGVQMIIVSHQDGMKYSADRNIQVVMGNKGVSQVRCH